MPDGITAACRSLRIGPCRMTARRRCAPGRCSSALGAGFASRWTRPHADAPCVSGAREALEHEHLLTTFSGQHGLIFRPSAHAEGRSCTFMAVAIGTRHLAGATPCRRNPADSLTSSPSSPASRAGNRTVLRPREATPKCRREGRARAWRTAPCTRAYRPIPASRCMSAHRYSGGTLLAGDRTLRLGSRWLAFANHRRTQVAV